ncbi:MAG: LysR substrate-binding domain-containing protein [Sedimenticola sp.]
MKHDIDTDLLRTLVAIVDAGGFTRASQMVHRSQSAVSMQMKKLEELVGRPLFEKSGRGASLTVDGEMLLGYARRILKLHDEMLSTVSQPHMIGSVCVGIPDDYMATYIPGILTKFASAYPQVQVEVLCEPSEWLINRLRRGEIDLGVFTEMPGSVTGEVLRRESTVWVTSRYHNAHEHDPLPLTLFQKGCKIRNVALKALDRVGRAYRIAYSSPSISGIESIVGAGLGVTVLVRSILKENMRELTAQEGFPDLPESFITLHRSDKDKSPVIDSLSEYIRDGFRSESN